MILVVEPQCPGAEHALVNAALLAVLREAFPADALVFWGEAGQVAEVGRELEERGIGGVKARAIAIPPRQLGNVPRTVPEFALAFEAFRTAAVQGARRLVFSSVTGPGLWAMKACSRAFPAVQAVAIPHSILDSIAHPPRRGLLGLPFWFRPALALANHPRLRYLLLSPAIATQLARELPRVAPFADAIDLPYFFGPPSGRTLSAEGPIRFGFLGVGRLERGIDAFFRLADTLRESGARFVLAGSLTEPLDVPPNVEIAGRGAMLDRPAFEALLRTLDYAVFPHPPGSTPLKASGSLFDALSAGLPVLAVRNPFFAHYFDRLGEIGTLCEDEDALRGVLASIASTPPVESHARMRRTILASCETLQPRSLAATLLEIWP